MNLPTYFSEPQVQSLQQVIEDIRRGGLLIPRFQRLFQWTDEQRLTLLQSVREGLPIGSILVWRTTEHKLDTFQEIAGAKVPTPSTEGPPWQYLLDGHQRLTTLFGALTPRRLGASRPQNSEDPQIGIDWNIYFDLQNHQFLFKGRQNPPPFWIPTSILLDSVALLKFQRDLISSGGADNLVEAADRVALAFRGYKIPVIPIVTNNLQNVTVAFQRVNSGGTQMSDADMVIALTFNNQHDLRRELELATDRLKEVMWGSFDHKYLLAVVRVRQNLDIATPDAGATSNAISRQPQLIQEATDSVLKVAKFLFDHCNIAGPNVVPYSYQSVLLAEALRLNPNPSASISRELCRWFWATTYSAYFLGARDGAVSQALTEIRTIAQGGDPKFANSKLRIESFPNRFDFRAARCKALATLLVGLKPRDLTEKPFDAARLLALSGRDALFQLVSREHIDSSIFSTPENRFLLPPLRATSLFAKSFLLPLLSLGPDWCDSHAISEVAWKELERGNFDKFLKVRRTTIQELENSFLNRWALARSDS